MKNMDAPAGAKTCRPAREQAANQCMSSPEPMGGYPNSFVQGNRDESKCDGLAGKAAAEHRSSLLSKIFADFDARGVGLKMSDNLSRDDLYQRGRIRIQLDRQAP